MLGSLILLWTSFCILFVLFRIQRPKNFPPGPQPIPIFGNLLQLNLGKLVRDLKKLSERYGKVYSIYLGRKPAVVLNGLQAMKEALVTQSVEFAGRPKGLMINHLLQNKGNATDPQTLFHKATFNIICTVLVGTRFKHEDEFLQLNIRCIRETTKTINGPWAMKAFQNMNMIRKSLADQVSQHKESRVPGEPRDLTDCYLDEMEKRGDDGSSFSENQLVFYLLDLFFAGTDTTSNTLLTAFLYLMTHPDVQERCQKEIDKVLGEKMQVSFVDRHRMPYTQAVIHEVQRVADTVPLAAFHATTKDTRLMGYDIPKGTIIIPNLSSVLSEETQWKFPHEFNPSNFLNDEGEFVKPEAFMPFSAGSRVCLGEGLARMELFLILVTLLRRFKFIWPEDAGVPDYTPVFGLTHSPKHYRLGVRLRGSGDLGP
ncbi:hypothetical protein COCON_G00109370 [Conger conger]|uniref:Cytochrome P450 n=1 Tax=Conger conger TaxID=82655 RepID=A0A9Q1DK34_CONCO|nr:hypothetical protein COCON_G00109370 [Conger conger]